LNVKQRKRNGGVVFQFRNVDEQKNFNPLIKQQLINECCTQ